MYITASKSYMVYRDGLQQCFSVGATCKDAFEMTVIDFMLNECRRTRSLAHERIIQKTQQTDVL